MAKVRSWNWGIFRFFENSPWGEIRKYFVGSQWRGWEGVEIRSFRILGRFCQESCPLHHPRLCFQVSFYSSYQLCIVNHVIMYRSKAANTSFFFNRSLNPLCISMNGLCALYSRIVLNHVIPIKFDFSSYAFDRMGESKFFQSFQECLAPSSKPLLARTSGKGLVCRELARKLINFDVLHVMPYEDLLFVQFIRQSMQKHWCLCVMHNKVGEKCKFDQKYFSNYF